MCILNLAVLTVARLTISGQGFILRSTHLQDLSCEGLLYESTTGTESRTPGAPNLLNGAAVVRIPCTSLLSLHR